MSVAIAAAFPSSHLKLEKNGSGLKLPLNMQTLSAIVIEPTFNI